MKTSTLLAGGGLLGAVAASIVLLRKADATKSATQDAVGGDAAQATEAAARASAAKTPADVQAAASEVQAAAKAAPPVSQSTQDEAAAAVSSAASASSPSDVKAAADQVKAVASKITRAQIALRLTGYWPFSATASERKMEGGLHDRRGGDLHTIEDYFAGKSDHVSLSGDDAAWPYGQKVTFSWSDGRKVVGRVTDTGKNFRGSNKVYRAQGREPIDVCVASSSTKVPVEVTATIIKGDSLDKRASLDTSRFQGQSVTVGALHMLGAA